MIEPLIVQALLSLGFNTGWALYGDEIDGLVWVDDVENKPTNEEILAEVNKID
jgi:hypothetical protein